MAQKVFTDKVSVERPKMAGGLTAHYQTLADGDSCMLIYPRSRLLILKGFIIGIPLMALLIGPIYPLFKLSNYEITERTLTAIMFTQLSFTCLFALCLKFLTRPRRQELFAASVA